MVHMDMDIYLPLGFQLFDSCYQCFLCAVRFCALFRKFFREHPEAFDWFYKSPNRLLSDGIFAILDLPDTHVVGIIVTVYWGCLLVSVPET